MTIDERLEALTMNLESAHRDIVALHETTRLLITLAQKDAENIRALTGVVAGKGTHRESGRRPLGPLLL